VNLRFLTIDLERHAATCVAFRRDSYVVSFGTDERFVRESGADGSGYLSWLADRIARFPDGHVHVWDGDTIVGQMEMYVRPGPPPAGYVNLFYLVPEWRGRGAGDALQRYATSYFAARAIDRATLTVSATNAQARAYYVKHGWRDLGADPEREGVHTMELRIR